MYDIIYKVKKFSEIALLPGVAIQNRGLWHYHASSCSSLLALDTVSLLQPLHFCISYCLHNWMSLLYYLVLFTLLPALIKKKLGNKQLSCFANFLAGNSGVRSGHLFKTTSSRPSYLHYLITYPRLISSCLHAWPIKYVPLARSRFASIDSYRPQAEEKLVLIIQAK